MTSKIKQWLEPERPADGITRPCPICRENGYYHRKAELQDGKRVTLTISCQCRLRRAQATIKGKIEKKYRDFRLPLTPCPSLHLSMERQKKLYDFVNANPTASLALFGGTATGKSAVTYAMYRYAAMSRVREMWRPMLDRDANPVHFGLTDPFEFPIFHLDMRQYLRDLTERDCGRGDGPEITPMLIKRITDGGTEFGRYLPQTVRLFIEEFGKVGNLTPTRHDDVFALASAFRGNECQVVFNCNVTPEEFEELYGSAVMERVRETCKIVNLNE